MGFSIGQIFKGILRKGFRITWSSGPMFDPRDQVRTDAVEDLVKQKTREEEYVELDSKPME